MRWWHHQLTHLNIHKDWSRNVFRKNVKLQNVTTSLFLIRFSSFLHQSVGKLLSFEIMVILDWTSPLKNFHAYCTSTKADDIFSKLAGNEHEQTRRFLQQYVLRMMLEKVMKDCVRDEYTAGSQEEPEISVHDDQVLRYLAGYIPVCSS